MKLRVLYFAALRDAVGKAGEDFELPAGIDTVADLRRHLAAQPGTGALATFKNLRCAVNQSMVGFDAVLRAGDEVAFFPPVTGG